MLVDLSEILEKGLSTNLEQGMRVENGGSGDHSKILDANDVGVAVFAPLVNLGLLPKAREADPEAVDFGVRRGGGLFGYMFFGRLG